MSIGAVGIGHNLLDCGKMAVVLMLWNKEKSDSRPGEECNSVAPAGERLRSLVQSNANVRVIPSNEGTQWNSMEFES
jgi:hypothetical protein